MLNTLHLAKIIITNDKEPILNGGLLIHDSKIINIGKKEDFGDLKNTQLEIIDHGNALICPGFINLHTHLLYSNLGHIDGKDGLFPWLEKLTDRTSSLTEDDFIASIKYGINQALSTGTTFIVENTPNHLSTQELMKSPIKALIGFEIFGSDEDKADEIFNEVQSLIYNQSRINPVSTKLDFTFSPHAPYDVSKPLWKKLIEWSKNNDKLLLTHLEESPQEKLWWQEKSGQAINFWKKLNKLESKVKYWKKYNSGIDFLNKNHILASNIIASHLCKATKEDLLVLKEKNISLVHCPRSNFYLNNGTANIQKWNELNILWGIGTDSIASNINLDMLEEVRFTINQQKLIYNFSLSAKDAFLAITKNAAKILSMDSKIGGLKTNFCADFLVYEIPNKPDSTYKDPYELVIWDMDNNKNLKEVWINGEKDWITHHSLTKI